MYFCRISFRFWILEKLNWILEKLKTDPFHLKLKNVPHNLISLCGIHETAETIKSLPYNCSLLLFFEDIDISILLLNFCYYYISKKRLLNKQNFQRKYLNIKIGNNCWKDYWSNRIKIKVDFDLVFQIYDNVHSRPLIFYYVVITV